MNKSMNSSDDDIDIIYNYPTENNNNNNNCTEYIHDDNVQNTSLNTSMDDLVLIDIPVYDDNKEIGVSLPSPDEIKIDNKLTFVSSTSSEYDDNTNGNSNSYSRKKKLLIRILGSFVLFCLLLVIVPTTTVRKNNDNNDNNTITDPMKISLPGRRSNFTSVTNYLIENGISDPNYLYNETTSQYRTAIWLANEDGKNLNIPMGNIHTSTEGYTYLVRYVMALNYFALNGGSVPGISASALEKDNKKKDKASSSEWKARYGFLSLLPPCEWNGMNAQFVSTGLLCDHGLPSSLHLDENNLQGQIPSENGLLSSLTTLDLKGNHISGTIPTELCQLSNLEALELSSNQLRGTIPECIYQMKNLQRIIMDQNRLTGPLPNRMNEMHQLTQIHLDHNQLHGNPIPSLSNLNNLQLLHIRNNSFIGKMDSKFLMNATNLEKLDLSMNKFTLAENDVLPKHFFEHQKLDALDLSYNNFRGQLPALIDPINSTVLEFLSLSNNSFHGHVPANLTKLRGLLHLDISSNSFEGTIPNTFGELPSLKYLSVADNPLLAKGAIPTTLFLIPNLEYLNLRNTNRINTIPEHESPQIKLSYLDLSHNQLSGTIPLSLGEHYYVKYLLLNDNPTMKGNLPKSMMSWKDLKASLFHGTRLYGSFEVLCFNNPGVVIFVDCTVQNGGCICCRCCSRTDSKCSTNATNSIDTQPDLALLKQSDILDY